MIDWEAREEARNFAALAGKTVTAVYMNGDQKIQFVCGAERITYVADAECCSHTYAHHIEGLANLLGRRIVSVAPREMTRAKKKTFEDGVDHFDDTVYVKIYGVDLTTDRGNCYIEFRNDSNGYYGGAMELVDEAQLLVTPVTEDF